LKNFSCLNIRLNFNELDTLGAIIERILLVEEILINNDQINHSKKQNWIPVLDFIKNYKPNISKINNNSFRLTVKMPPRTFEIESLSIPCILEMINMGMGKYNFTLKLNPAQGEILSNLRKKIHNSNNITSNSC